jgi:hypothetical protein
MPKHEINKLTNKEGYGRASSCKLLEEKKQVMLKAATPGCGKS